MKSTTVKILVLSMNDKYNNFRILEISWKNEKRVEHLCEISKHGYL